MSDTKFYFSPMARVNDVQLVIALSLGCPKEIRLRQDQSDEEPYQIISTRHSFCYYADIFSKENGLSTGFNSTLELRFKPEVPSGSEYAYYFSVEGNSLGEKYFSGSSHPVTIAVGLRLMSIFGGRFYAHEKDKEPTLIVEKGIFQSFWIDNEQEGFVQRHQFFNKIEPLEIAELRYANQFCAKAEKEDITENSFWSDFLFYYYQKMENALPIKDDTQRHKMKI